jgi:hypothetical protein
MVGVTSVSGFQIDALITVAAPLPEPVINQTLIIYPICSSSRT